MKVVRHDAVVAALDIVPISGVAKDSEKHAVVVIIEKDLHPTVASRDHVTQKVLVLTTLWSRHAFVYTRSDPFRNIKENGAFFTTCSSSTRFSRDSCPRTRRTFCRRPQRDQSGVRVGSEWGQSRVRVGSDPSPRARLLRRLNRGIDRCNKPGASYRV